MSWLTDTLGGYWVSILLLIRCRFRTGKGSYLAWRNETAFGKDGQYPEFTKRQRRATIRHWARWAWRNRN